MPTPSQAKPRSLYTACSTVLGSGEPTISQKFKTYGHTLEDAEKNINQMMLEYYGDNSYMEGLIATHINEYRC
ncbi:MAG TPA: hypothetical protein VLB90_11735 [Pseudomonadales bacterium]|nr:hypothetical protein [Pseudomonadales bacterium]